MLTNLPHLSHGGRWIKYPALMSERPRTFSAPAPLVGLASWILPGAGYWLIGQRARAVTVGFTIIALFLLGLLIGGVRSLEVPGYSGKAKAIRVATHLER